MKTTMKTTLGRMLRLAVAGLLTLVAGCNDQYLFWSPKGDRAAVLAKDGLRICDAAGRLSEPLAADVARVAWLPDGGSMVLVRAESYTDWKACAAALGREPAERITKEAGSLAEELRAGREWQKPGEGNARRRLVQQFAAREFRGALRGRVGEQQLDEAAAAPFVLWVIAVARLDGTTLRDVRRLNVSPFAAEEPRVSPDGRAVAFARTDDRTAGDGLSLWVQPLDVEAVPVRVAMAVNRYPDWTSDSRALVYLQAGVGGESSGGLELGTVSKRVIRDAGGAIAPAEKSEELAGLVMNAGYRVRCLADGRVLFTAAEFTLPMAARDFGEEKEQLYALDPARHATLVRLIPRSAAAQMPRTLSRFELSPDERQIIVGGDEGEVLVMTLATGEVQVLQGAGGGKVRQLPGWRAAGEPWYVRRGGVPGADGKPRIGEVVVGTGEAPVILSADWPEAVRERLVDPDKK